MEIIFCSLVAGAIFIAIRILYDFFHKIKNISESNTHDTVRNDYYPYKKSKQKEPDMKYAIIVLCVCMIFLIGRSNAHSRTKTDVKYFPYRKKHLLTKAEYVFYNELVNRTKRYDIVICPKVRMEDFIDVTDIQNRQKYRGYIKSRHVDFLLCDSKLNILGAIELDDPSHNYESVQRTDDFKNKVYNAIGVKLYRITYKQEYDQQITNMLKDVIDRNKKQN